MRRADTLTTQALGLHEARPDTARPSWLTTLAILAAAAFFAASIWYGASHL